MSREITVSVFVNINGKDIPFEELTEEQLKMKREEWKGRLSRNMSRYYTYHMDEYKRLKTVW